jgi:hypothetical protein
MNKLILTLAIVLFATLAVAAEDSDTWTHGVKAEYSPTWVRGEEELQLLIGMYWTGYVIVLNHDKDSAPYTLVDPDHRQYTYWMLSAAKDDGIRNYTERKEIQK